MIPLVELQKRYADVPGMTTRLNEEKGALLVRLHYTADPKKRDPKWKEQAQKGWASDADWKLEFEIDRARSGRAYYPPYAENPTRYLLLFPYTIMVQVPVVRGWDFGGAHPACYSTDTEVLTETGWRPMVDVGVGERVYTLNTRTREMELQPVRTTISYPYTGEMLEWFGTRNNGTALRVTANHLMLTEECRRGGRQLHFRRADALPATLRNRLPTAVGWQGTDGPYPLGLSGGAYAALMGLYLSEGHTRYDGKHYYTWIYQDRKSKRLPAIGRLLASIPRSFRWYESGDGWCSAGADLYQHLLPYGLAWEKYVPAVLLNAPASVIESFLYAFALGDGSFRTDGRIKALYTTSSRMAGQLQEMFAKLGVHAVVLEHPKEAPRHTYYSVRPHWHYRPRLIHERREKVTGEPVVCLTVDNHTLYVRRKGRPAWCGNCVWIQYSRKARRIIALREILGVGIDTYAFRDLVRYLSGQLTLADLKKWPRAMEMLGELDDDPRYPPHPWFRQPFRYLDFSGHEGVMGGRGLIRAGEDQTASEILAAGGVHLLSHWTSIKARRQIILGLSNIRADGYPGLLLDRGCPILIEGLTGEIKFKKPTPNDPDPIEPHKDDFYSHIHDALGYGVVNTIRAEEADWLPEGGVPVAENITETGDSFFDSYHLHKD